MALPTNAVKKTYGTTVNHIINGAQILDGAFSLSTDIDNAFTNADGYAFADIALTFTKAAAGSAGLTISLFRRNLDIVGTNDEPIPDSNYEQTLVGIKIVDAISTEQYVEFSGISIPTQAGCEFYIKNNTGQTINATWDLDIKPWTWMPA